MKHIITIIALLVSTSAFAGGHIESKCYPPDGTIWEFEIYTDDTDQWDSSKSEHPPLSPKNAKDLATAFMQRVPLGDKMTGWSITTITLRRMSEEPEQWIYEAHFIAIPPGDWNGPLPWFTVPVRMDGSIPEPMIEKKTEENRSEQSVAVYDPQLVAMQSLSLASIVYSTAVGRA